MSFGQWTFERVGEVGDRGQLDVDGHVIEVQLHLASIYRLKTGGGHKGYVLARNLRGE